MSNMNVRKFRGKAANDVRCMMRDEILWKKGDWVYGNLVKGTPDWWIVGDVVEYYPEGIVHEWRCRVDPITVGQAIGIKDDEDVEIYEDDFLLYSGASEYRGIEGITRIERDPSTGYYPFTFLHEWNASLSKSEVIGNIHDNPEITQVHISS